MSLRDDLRSSLRKDSKNSGKGAAHSKAYHRFFEGYSEINVPKRSGKGSRIQRTYTGNYFHQDLTKRQRILIRILYVAIFLCAGFYFVSGATLPLTINSTWYVVLPEAVSLVFLFWILIAFISYLPAEQKMTIEDYRSSSLSLLKATLGAAISLGSTAFATLIFILLNPSHEPQRVLLCTGYLFVGGLLTLGMNWTERKVKYSIIPSQNLFPEDSVEIQ